MSRFHLTVTQKVAVGYLLISLFSLIALGYALSGLQRQTSRSQRLIAVEFRSFNLLRDLHQTTLAQERIEKQLLVLRDSTLLDLAERRRQEFSALWQEFMELPELEAKEDLTALATPYLTESVRCADLLKKGDWTAAGRCAQSGTAPSREELLSGIDRWSQHQQDSIDQALQDLLQDSRRAYKVTLLLMLAGLGLSAPVALKVISGIHHSVQALVRGTHAIAAGTFDYQIGLESQDEFGHLAREFTEMGKKLKDLEARCLDANPLTRLPGNLVIDRELESRIVAEKPFAHLYIDLDNFKAFGDRYGYRAGSEVLAQVGDLIRKSVRDCGSDDDLVGHIGGDDYVVLTAPDQAEAIAARLISEFDHLVPGFYSEEDRQAGSFVARDRYGVERTFPLLTMSIAVIRSDTLEAPMAVAISRECAKMKEYLKELPGSNVLVNRRKKLI
jgi:GGDEF domain-containing protein/CHASE3 domain sensor protein